MINENDRAPEFTQPTYFVNAAENSPENTILIKIEAVDPDSPAGVKYAIIKGNPQSHFTLDETTGYLITGRRHLDREAQAEHELHIQACDQGQEPQLCSTAIVEVSVDDVNDNAPVFDRMNTTVEVPAERAGLLVRVSASDADMYGPNSEISYRLKIS